MGRRKNQNILASLPRENFAHDYWVEKMSLRALAKKYNCTHTYVRLLLAKFGIPKRKRLIDSISRRQLHELYISDGLSEDDIALKLHCSKSHVCNLLALHGIPKRDPSQARNLALKKGKITSTRMDEYGKLVKVQHHRRTVNSRFFKTWSPEMAYVLGVIATDGYLFQYRGTSGFSVSQKERELLDKILVLMGSNAKILFKKQRGGFGGSRYFFTITNKEMFDDLLRLGLTPRKSLTLTFPDTPGEYVRHFIRGCWDGDGSVYLGGGSLSQAASSIGSGSKAFIDGIKSHLRNLGLPDRPIDISRNGKNNFFSIRFFARDTAKLYKVLYEGVSEAVYLTRKQTCFKAIADHFSFKAIP